ncbi:hypothetical protein POTOM_021963 [Populus tomentosa]|uniref:Uncharacterized protein n=1 Tax=Populus tomentosa TaxID=118781 RepID=A0A8X7ZYE0_POPTO|nr:hypothetical protein POTOM_021963 [Populus tomentosa]
MPVISAREKTLQCWRWNWMLKRWQNITKHRRCPPTRRIIWFVHASVFLFCYPPWMFLQFYLLREGNVFTVIFGQFCNLKIRPRKENGILLSCLSGCLCWESCLAGCLCWDSCLAFIATYVVAQIWFWGFNNWIVFLT